MKNWLLTDLGLVITEDGFVKAQARLDGDGASSPEGETHFPYGLYARPHAPTDEGACSAFIGWQNDALQVLPTYDPRAIGKLPALDDGESVTFGGTLEKLGFAHFSSKDTWTLYVPVDTSGGVVSKAHAVTVGKDANGHRTLNLVHADGMAVLMNGDDKSLTIKNAAGTAAIVLKEDGSVLIFGKKVQFYGPVLLGAQGLPVALFNGAPGGVASLSAVG